MIKSNAEEIINVLIRPFMKFVNKTNIGMVCLVGLTFIFFNATANAGTLDEVRKNGHVKCGVSQGLPGFSNPDDKGGWSGIDVEYCRAVAAAVFGDSKAVMYRPLNAKDRFAALNSGEIDVLSRNTTMTLTRDTSVGLNFPGILFYDGQGFMVRKSLGVSSALELSGASVCVQSGTTTELNVNDYFAKHNMKFEIVAFEDNAEAIKAYANKRCDVFTTDTSGLYGIRLRLTDPEGSVVLPEIISKEPLGPAVRQGDDQWFNVTMWSLFAMVQAEELGITKANVAEMKKSDDPKIQRFLGVNGNDYGKSLGLEAGWAAAIVEQVGNYGEVFERTVGKDSPLKISRGLNKLWTDGGLQYSPPFR